MTICAGFLPSTNPPSPLFATTHRALSTRMHQVFPAPALGLGPGEGQGQGQGEGTGSRQGGSLRKIGKVSAPENEQENETKPGLSQRISMKINEFMQTIQCSRSHGNGNGSGSGRRVSLMKTLAGLGGGNGSKKSDKNDANSASGGVHRDRNVSMRKAVSMRNASTRSKNNTRNNASKKNGNGLAGGDGRGVGDGGDVIIAGEMVLSVLDSGAGMIINMISQHIFASFSLPRLGDVSSQPILSIHPINSLLNPPSQPILLGISEENQKLLFQEGQQFNPEILQVGISTHSVNTSCCQQSPDNVNTYLLPYQPTLC